MVTFGIFSCKSGGGVVDFVSKMESMSKPLAIQLLMNKYGIEIEINSDKRLLTEIIESLVTYHPYLESRGISKEVANKYRVGFCSDYQALLDKFGINGQVATNIGLFDITDCIVYPYFDYEGCIKISARSIHEKRYMSSHKTDLWKYHLWGIEHIKSKKVYVFEGFHDVMVAHQYGIPAVALSGTNIVDDYWEQLRHYNIEEVVFVPDGDYGGKSLMDKLVGEYDNTFNVSVVDLESGDPDDAIIAGDHENWEELLPLQWYSDYKWQNVTTLQDKVRMYRDISKFYCKMTSWEQELYKSYFKSKDGEEGLDYLTSNIKPDWRSERIVLANCMYSDNVRIETLQSLNTEDFTLTTYRNIFEFMKHNTVTPVLIKKNFDVDLSEFVDLVNYRRYIGEVKSVSVRMRLCDEFNKSISKLQSMDVIDVVGDLSDKMISIVDNKEYVYDSGEIVKEVMNNISDRVEKPQVMGVSLNESKFPMTNRSLLGFIPSKLILVSGATGHGKTTTIQNWIDDLIFDKNENILFFSLEMTPNEIIEKQIAIRAQISGTKILTGSLEQSEYDEVLKVSKTLLKSRMKIVHGVYDLYKILNIAKSIIIRNRCRVVFLDYVQLITMNNKKDRWQQLMDITANIKRQLCNDYGVTFVAVSQLGKSALNSTVAEVKDVAGSFGMLADIDIGMSVRQRYGSEISDGSNFEIFIDKHRYGRDKLLIPAVFNKGTLEIKEC